MKTRQWSQRTGKHKDFINTKFSCETNHQDANFPKKYLELVTGYMTLYPDWEFKGAQLLDKDKGIVKRFYFGELKTDPPPTLPA